MTEKKAISQLTTLIPWAIERILRVEYTLETDTKGLPKVLELDPSYGVISTKDMMEDLRSLSPEVCQLIDELKRDHSVENLRRILPRILLPVLAKQLIEEYVNIPSWNQIVHDIYWTMRSGLDLSKILANERIGLGSKIAARFVERLEQARPGISFSYTADKYANELITLYPRIVNRAASLRILQTGKTAPKEIKRYLEEASRCFIFGNFLASLFVCRSAIEAAVEYCLREKGYGLEVDHIVKDKLRSLLELAFTKKILNEAYLQKADYVRNLANKAVHGKQLPEEIKCQGAYDMTRSVIEYLYS